MHRKMLRGCHHVGFINRRAVALKSANRRQPNMRHQIWIFAVCFFRASPSRIARQIQNWRETLLRSTRPHFRGHGSKYVANQHFVPCGRKSNRRWKCRTLRRRVPMQALFVEHDWNSQPRILFHPFLNRVCKFRHFARPAAHAGILARARNLAQSILQRDLRALRKEGAFFIRKERLRLPYKCTVSPRALDLRQFLFDRHPREQISNALLNGKLWILVGGHFLRDGRRAARRPGKNARQHSKNRSPNSSAVSHATTSGTSWPLHSLGRVVLYTAVNVNGKDFCYRAFVPSILAILFFDSCPGDPHERCPVSAEARAQIYVWALDGRQPRPRPFWRFCPSASLPA